MRIALSLLAWLLGAGHIGARYTGHPSIAFWLKPLPIALFMGLALLASRAISRPIPRLSGVMKKIAANELDAEVPYTDRANEIGEMARLSSDLEKFLDPLALDEETRHAAQFALEELFSNIVRYAYDDQRQHLVVVGDRRGQRGRRCIDQPGRVAGGDRQHAARFLQPCGHGRLPDEAPRLWAGRRTLSGLRRADPANPAGTALHLLVSALPEMISRRSGA